MRSPLTRIAVALLLSVVPVTAHAVPIVTNGGFETGDLTGWTATGADLAAAWLTGTVEGTSHSGQYFFIGFDNSGFATLSQTVATAVGGLYSFSFFSNTNVPGAAGNILRYQIGSGSIVTVPNSFAWAETVTTFVATSVATEIQFYFETDPGTGTHRLDDVSVGVEAIPEPTTLSLLGLGLAGLAAARRRRNRS
jgi:hypothetical protein